MSKYTTGELAKLCGVSVRTVQYYDTRGILVPSELSEGGRRLYSEDDLRRMKIICFLRGLDLPINSIGELLAEKDPGSVIDLLLGQQEQLLREEIGQRQERLQTLMQLKRDLGEMESFSIESIGDVAHMMDNRKKLHKTRAIMLGIGIPVDILEWGAFIYALYSHNWWPFALSMAVVIIATIWVVRYYYRNVRYICPQCHTVFQPKFKEFMFSNHTINTRKLHCTNCGHHGFCVETGAEEK